MHRGFALQCFSFIVVLCFCTCAGTLQSLIPLLPANLLNNLDYELMYYLYDAAHVYGMPNPTKLRRNTILFCACSWKLFCKRLANRLRCKRKRSLTGSGKRFRDRFCKHLANHSRHNQRMRSILPRMSYNV